MEGRVGREAVMAWWPWLRAARGCCTALDEAVRRSASATYIRTGWAWWSKSVSSKRIPESSFVRSGPEEATADVSAALSRLPRRWCIARPRLGDGLNEQSGDLRAEAAVGVAIDSKMGTP